MTSDLDPEDPDSSINFGIHQMTLYVTWLLTDYADLPLQRIVIRSIENNEVKVPWKL